MQVVHTPKSVKGLIIATTLLTLLCPLVTFFMHHFFAKSGPLEWFSLSYEVFEKGYVWQLLTYFFIQTTTTEITLSLFINLFITMFLLWLCGKELYFRFGNLKFTCYYLLAGLVSGLTALLYFYFSHATYAIASSTAPLFACLVLWIMIFPGMQFHYLFLLKVNAKVLLCILLAIPLLIHLSTGQFALFLNELTGIAFGYLTSYFLMTRPKGRNVVDLEDYESDEDFMDRMLDKIAKGGANSLSVKERKRMEAISRKNRR